MSGSTAKPTSAVRGLLRARSWQVAPAHRYQEFLISPAGRMFCHSARAGSSSEGPFPTEPAPTGPAGSTASREATPAEVGGSAPVPCATREVEQLLDQRRVGDAGAARRVGALLGARELGVRVRV